MSVAIEQWFKEQFKQYPKKVQDEVINALWTFTKQLKISNNDITSVNPVTNGLTHRISFTTNNNVYGSIEMYKTANTNKGIRFNIDNHTLALEVSGSGICSALLDNMPLALEHYVDTKIEQLSSLLSALSDAFNEFKANNTLSELRDTVLNYLVPSGAILVWSGSESNIPSGWLLCDGNNGTPDLRGRFVLGSSSNRVTGSKGGSAVFGTHYHYVGYGNTSQDGYHLGTEGKNFKSALPTIPNAVIKFNDFEGDSGRGWSTIDRDSNDGWNSNNGENLVTSLNYANGTTNKEGTSETLPPYYALCYIMKV